jgi:hypothetical protein
MCFQLLGLPLRTNLLDLPCSPAGLHRSNGRVGIHPLLRHEGRVDEVWLLYDSLVEEIICTVATSLTVD